VKETHREPTDLQPFAAATEDRNVTRVAHETDSAVDRANIDSLDRVAEILDSAREQDRVREHETFLIEERFGLKVVVDSMRN
jgi:hypothetical protein